MWRAAAPDESHRRAIVADEGERQRRGGEIADSRDWDDVWRRLGAAGSKGGGQRRRQRRGGFGLISLFSIPIITLVLGGPVLKFVSSKNVSPLFSNFWSDRRTENSLFRSPGVG